MKPRINYNFDRFLELFRLAILTREVNYSTANSLRKELNTFFKDADCKDFLYTKNTDKMFFGMKVISNIDARNIYEYLMGNNDIRIVNYSIEMDSKLLDPMLNLTAEELLAILLHEVGHVVNDSEPVNKARELLNSYMEENKETLPYTDAVSNKEILAYGLRDYISKQGSMFYTDNDQEILADDFVRMCGFIEHLDSALTKIKRSNMKLYDNSEVSKFVTFYWSLRLYKHITTRRIAALKLLTRTKQLTASTLEKREIEKVIRSVKFSSDLSDTSIHEGVGKMVKSKMAKMRRDSIRSLSDDYYELNMRIRNVEDEEDALYLMRQINTRISIIGDYINTEDDVSDEERKHFRQMLDKFIGLREELSKATVYKSKTYGLYVNYPDIKPGRY